MTTPVTNANNSFRNVSFFVTAAMNSIQAAYSQHITNSSSSSSSNSSNTTLDIIMTCRPGVSS